MSARRCLNRPPVYRLFPSSSHLLYSSLSSHLPSPQPLLRTPLPLPPNPILRIPLSLIPTDRPSAPRHNPKARHPHLKPQGAVAPPHRSRPEPPGGRYAPHEGAWLHADFGNLYSQFELAPVVHAATASPLASNAVHHPGLRAFNRASVGASVSVSVSSPLVRVVAHHPGPVLLVLSRPCRASAAQPAAALPISMPPYLLAHRPSSQHHCPCSRQHLFTSALATTALAGSPPAHAGAAN
ncbi:hypothetical protein K438DRAFT_1954106 [Mycena galopus ATCC 62051]|nr:hypothetical protein K438DRAFT_1954106 [Mycena galopus ATCC 62051]